MNGVGLLLGGSCFRCFSFKVNQIGWLEAWSTHILKLSEQIFNSVLNSVEEVQSWDNVGLSSVLILEEFDLWSHFELSGGDKILAWDGCSSLGKEISELAQDVELLSETLLNDLSSRIEGLGSPSGCLDEEGGDLVLEG